MDCYLRPKLCAKWKNAISEPIPTFNGVKQGGNLSSTFFCIYLDELLHRLEADRAWCHIGTQFYGGLAYADDLTLVSQT